jgi:hypothetical protein
MMVPVNAGPDGVTVAGETAVNLDGVMAHDLSDCKEPSTDGTWYLIAVENLTRNGYDAIEIHYPDSENADTAPNAVVLHRGAFS